MTTKKDIPLSMLKAIEASAQANTDIICLKREENTYYSFIEIDPLSSNYFKVYKNGEKSMPNYSQENFVYEWKPNNHVKPTVIAHQGKIEDVVAQFEGWIKIIREMHNTPSVHDDNFSKTYADFYYNEFKIIDADANITPFNPDQQDSIELYLNSVQVLIGNPLYGIDEKTKHLISDEIEAVKTNIAIKTKNQVLKEITNFLGKLFTINKTLLKDAVQELKEQLLSKLVSTAINHSQNIIEAVTKHLIN